MTTNSTPRPCLEVTLKNETTGSLNVDFSVYMRAELKRLESLARDFISYTIESGEELSNDKRETIAHATLAMRDIENARMQYGKVIQYGTPNGDGESNYSK